MYHIVYKTTNTITSKFYIGIHSTKDLEDGYLGSGLLLQKSIQKYGKNSHKREILFYFLSREEAWKKESELINETTLKDPFCMNLHIGGRGGWDYVNSNRIISYGFKDKSHSLDNKKLFSEIKIKHFSSSENRKIHSKYLTGQKRKSNARPLRLISPNGVVYNLDVLQKSLSDFCKEHFLPIRIMKNWVDKGVINFPRPTKKTETLNTTGWVISSQV
jgi:hypothetical protein